MNESIDAIRAILVILNFALCSALGWACLCRLNVMEGKDTRTVFRLKYAVLLTAATAGGFCPLFGEWPTWTQCGMTGAVLFQLAGGARAWANGVPVYAKSDPAPFDALDTEPMEVAR